jgi:hypothetical protein
MPHIFNSLVGCAFGRLTGLRDVFAGAMEGVAGAHDGQQGEKAENNDPFTHFFILLVKGNWRRGKTMPPESGVEKTVTEI